MSAAAQAAVREHYDALYWHYRLLWGDYLHHGLFRAGDESPREAQLALLRHCVRLLPEEPRGCVLDVGCGYGTTSLFLAREFGCHVEGISLSPRQVRYAQSKASRAGLRARVVFSVTDAEQFDYGLARYDLLWVMESSEHFADRQAFFRRAVSALRSGGAMLVAAWTAGENADAAALARVAEASVCPSFSNAPEYLAMLSNGASVVAAEDLTNAVLPTWDIVAQRVQRLRFLTAASPRPVREFSKAVHVIRDAFRSRLLTYHVFVAVRC